LPCGAYGTCADEFRALLAPYPARAREHPRGADSGLTGTSPYQSVPVCTARCWYRRFRRAPRHLQGRSPSASAGMVGRAGYVVGALAVGG
jgi:hypothetical protein